MDFQNWIINMTPGFTILLMIGAIWSLIWKGIALWKAAKNNDKAWFVALMIINTLGILEIFYIYVFSKRDITTNK
jgi:hypothetical protein